MSKDWEIFTAEHFHFYHYPKQKMADHCNRILNERMPKLLDIQIVDINNVYQINSKLVPFIENGKQYEYMEVLRPIEKEVEECECLANSHKLKLDKHNIISVDYIDNNFCPKCGQDLRGDNNGA